MSAALMVPSLSEALGHYVTSHSVFILYIFNYTHICTHTSSPSYAASPAYNDWGIQVNMLTRFNNSGSCCSTRMDESAHCSSWQVLITAALKALGHGGFNHWIIDQREASNWDVIKVKVVIIVSANWADKCVMVRLHYGL